MRPAKRNIFLCKQWQSESNMQNETKWFVQTPGLLDQKNARKKMQKDPSGARFGAQKVAREKTHRFGAQTVAREKNRSGARFEAQKVGKTWQETLFLQKLVVFCAILMGI